jgi:hypothetical protein
MSELSPNTTRTPLRPTAATQRLSAAAKASDPQDRSAAPYFELTAFFCVLCAGEFEGGFVISSAYPLPTIISVINSSLGL